MICGPHEAILQPTHLQVYMLEPFKQIVQNQELPPFGGIHRIILLPHSQTINFHFLTWGGGQENGLVPARDMRDLNDT